MNEFSNMYYYLKNMAQNDSEDNTDGISKKLNDELRIIEDRDTIDGKINGNAMEGETSSDPFSEQCTQNLEDKTNMSTDNEKVQKCRPTLELPKMTNEQLYQNDFMFHLDDTASRIQQAIEHDYLVQPSNIKVESPKFISNNYANSSRLNPQQGDIFLYSPTEENKAFIVDTPTSDISQINLNMRERNYCGSVKSDRESASPLTGQEELAEIITDFKNNVFSISEVEKLVMDWRNRNETQQSLKEKEEQLNKMREEYDKIQQRMKEKLKRPTPFERVKKMFSKNKNKSKEFIYKY